MIQYDESILKSAWKQAIAESKLDTGEKFTVEFFIDEWINVVQAQDIRTKDDYLAADRQGRGKRIDRETREKLWDVFKNYSQIMKENHWLDIDAAANHCFHQIQNNPSLRHYDSVIVDESPDFGPAQFRLLRVLCGEPHKDDLYITGDPRQQIYTSRPKLILSRCNINVRGRSTQLILNYRTTGNILKWANRLLHDIEYDDLDGGTDDIGTTVSTVEGEKPELRRFSTPAQEIDYICQKIRELISKGIVPDEIAVIARINPLLGRCSNALKTSGIPVFLSENGDEKANGVRFLTMHKSKGLEFSHVFVMGVNKDVLPHKRTLDDAQDAIEREHRFNQEKQLLHVALTRARNQGVYPIFCVNT